MTEITKPFSRIWVEFFNPDDEEELFKCDLTWLTSRWSCIFGKGCRGIVKNKAEYGCCNLGAYISDKEDKKRVTKWVSKLSKQDWQVKKKYEKKWLKKEGREWKTRIADGACVFLNREGFPGGAGCALHNYAINNDISHIETKPDVCWQLPIKRDYENREYTNGTEIIVTVITEYERRDWGEGGNDHYWYCSSNTKAHIATKPLYITERATLIKMMGKKAYEILAKHCKTKEASDALQLSVIRSPNAVIGKQTGIHAASRKTILEEHFE